MKKLFCMQPHMQHKMYLAHKREKENRKLQKVFYRRQGMEVESGSKERITDEEDWVYKFSTWEIDEDAAGTSSSAPPLAADEIVEASEEESSDEDGDDDEDYRTEE